MCWLRKNYFAFIVILNTWKSISCQDSDGYSYSKFLNDEGRLVRHLLNESHYEPIVRPADSEDSPPIRLDFGMYLVELFGIDEEKQVIELQVWLTKAWNDSRLIWEPSDFGGIKQIRIPIERLWRPDFVLLNGAFEAGEPSGIGVIYHSTTMVFHNGNVFWYPPARIKASCQLDMSKFPFDKQICSLKFMSWTHDSRYVDPQLLLEDFDHSQYTPNNIWELRRTWARRNDTMYTCCPESFPDLTFSLELSRRRGFYSYILVVPGIIISLLVPVMFLLTVGKAEKFILGCSLLVCLTLLTLLLEIMVPTAHSGILFIEVYYLGNFVITGIGLGISAAILNLSQCKSPPPSFLKKVIGISARCCCMTVPRDHSYNIHMNPKTDENPIAVDQDGVEGASSSDWIFIATVLDRFFLACSVIVTLLMTITMSSHN